MSEKTQPETYTISELAKLFDVTPRALRLYEESGLLNPKRDGSKRIFFERDRVRLRLLLRGKRLGYTLGDVKEFFDIYESNTGEEAQLQLLLEAINDKKKRLEGQKEDVENALKEIEQITSKTHEALRSIRSTNE